MRAESISGRMEKKGERHLGFTNGWGHERALGYCSRSVSKNEETKGCLGKGDWASGEKGCCVGRESSPKRRPKKHEGMRFREKDVGRRRRTYGKAGPKKTT